jgi:hypothetical protein
MSLSVYDALVANKSSYARATVESTRQAYLVITGAEDEHGINVLVECSNHLMISPLLIANAGCTLRFFFPTMSEQ